MGKNRHWEEDKNERFINPYNFVPLGEKCVRGSTAPKPGEGLTGYIECELIPLTPLFIPNTSNNKALHEDAKQENINAEKSYSYDFFSYADLSEKKWEDIKNSFEEPVIPGSEIRGAVRSVFEAAFEGCLSSVSLDTSLRRRSGSIKKPGLMKKNERSGEWEIVPRIRGKLKFYGKNSLGPHLEKDYRHWKEGQKLYVKLGENNYVTEYRKVNTPGFKEGLLHKGERGGKKKSESVFLEDEKNKRALKVKQEEVDRLQEVLDQYRDAAINVQLRKEEHKGYEKYKIDEKGTLVYYEIGKDNQPHYLSPACIGKEIYAQKLARIVEKNGNYLPCEKRNRLCPACSLFGIVSGENCSCSSRVRFEDAVLAEPPENYRECYLKETTLPELGQPRPGAVEFYTYRPKNAPYWTYDYRLERGRKEELSDAEPKIRGRKFYWHKSVPKEILACQEKPLEMRQRIRPLKSIQEAKFNKFRFHIYFKNLSDVELLQLRWALDFGEDKDEVYAHKLGRAKPLGFGSVQIQVGNVYLRKLDKETGDWKLAQAGWEECQNGLTLSIKHESEIKEIAKWKQKYSELVSYPKVLSMEERKNSKKNDNASHRWFAVNKEKIEGAKSNNPVFHKILPEISQEASEKEADKWLYKLVEKPGKLKT